MHPIRGLLLVPVSLCLAVVHGQMSTLSGTTLTVTAGTTVAVDLPVTWTVESGATVVNDGTILLGENTELDEAPGAAISGAGTERTQRTFVGPVLDVDPGGLGARLTTTTTLGTTVIERGHIPYTDYSGHTSIARWIRVDPANNADLNATVAFHYDPGELGGMLELEQVLHQYLEADVWASLPSSIQTAERTVTATGLFRLGLFTTFNEALPTEIAESVGSSTYQLLANLSAEPLLKVPEGGVVRGIELLDVLGRIVSSGSPQWSTGVYPLTVSGLAPGRYLVRVNGNTIGSIVQP